MTPLRRIIVVDDHPLLREGVSRSIAESGRYEVVAQGGSADDAVRLSAEYKPDIVLLDVSMPGGGIGAVTRVREVAPEAHIIMLTVSEADDVIVAALKAGARGYVLKGVSAQSLIEIIDGVARGESYVAPSLAARLLSAMGQARSTPSGRPEDALAALTAREVEILKLVSVGMSNKEIAIKLKLQEKTVKHHMTNVMSKLHVKNRTQAAVLMRETERDEQ